MILESGEKVHVITRRVFDGDLRRHFVGEVVAVEQNAVRLRGYVFIHDPGRNEFVKRTELRVRIVSMMDAGNILIVIPREVDLDALVYRTTREKRLVLTDGKSFQLDINEFSGVR